MQKPAEATLGGGCFWCLEAVFKALKGVVSVRSGYAGGHVQNPRYEDVCAGHTGHAEVVRILFDSSQITFEALLGVFFATHNPTTLNRQGHDVGTQYRSVIFGHDEEQLRAAHALKIKLSDEAIFDGPIVTEIVPLSDYYEAEAYHQDYYRNHPEQGYCAAVVAPKVAKFRRQYAHLLKEEG